MSVSVIESVATMSVEELMALQEATKTELENAKKRDREEFEQSIVNIKAKAELLGINLKSYFVEKKEYQAKFKDPNSDETWNGRGPRPAWLKALLADVPKEQLKEAMQQYVIAS